MNIFDNLRITVIIVFFLWLIFLLDFLLPIRLEQFGIYPRNIRTIYGILLSPFIHANIIHLIANTCALSILLFTSLSYSRSQTFEAIILTIFIGGGAVWLIGKPNTVHVGASGVIWGLIGFLLFCGLFQKNIKSICVSIIILFLYGGSLISLFRYVPGISFSGHLFGFLSGILAAWLSRPLEKV